MDENTGRGIEKAIQEAMQRGEFDDLPGKGKPLDLSGYFNAPEDQRLAQMILKNAQMLPREIELLQEIAGLQEQLEKSKEPGHRKSIQKTIEQRRLAFRLLVERMGKRQK